MKKGTVVNLRPDCSWDLNRPNNPLHMKGVVLECNYSVFLPVLVRWNNGTTNRYFEYDLEEKC